MISKKASAWFNTCLVDRKIERYKDEGELRYNPYHDPKDGRFTTANGGDTGGYLYVGKGEKGKGQYVIDSEKFKSNEQKNSLTVPRTDTPLLKELANAGIAYNPIKPLDKPLTEEEIINKLSSIDNTGGSCMSLALAYAGNKAGYDVTDLRGGESREFFSESEKKICKIKGVDSYTEREYNDIKATKKLLKNVQSGKEYILCTGEHAAVVRKKASGKGIEYLEMQLNGRKTKGFKNLSTKVLKDRFACQKTHTELSLTRPGHRDKFKVSSRLIDIESLGKSDEFLTMLGYINTAPGKQTKSL